MKKKTDKTIEQHEKEMQELADKMGLTFDGGDDNRLFTNYSSARTLQLSEEKYNKMETKLNDFCFKGEGFEVYAWNDCSGYEYWTIKQKEDNYIQITVNVLDALKVNPKELKDALIKTEQAFYQYRDMNFYEGVN